jgi:hypothetical protein
MCIFGAVVRLHPVALGNISYRNGEMLARSVTYQMPLERAYPGATSLMKYFGVNLA